MLPIVPDSLRELLEAPVPILIGMPAPVSKKKFPNIIWVNLDEPRSNKKLHSGPDIKEEVIEPFANGLKDKLKVLYKPFTDTTQLYEPNEPQRSAIKEICGLFEGYLKLISSKLPKSCTHISSSQELVSSLLPEFDKKDHEFLKLFISTQIVMTNITLN